MGSQIILLRRHALRGALLASLVLAGACSDDDDDAEPTPTTEPGITAAVDWTARTVTVEGFDGPAIAFCDGDAPLLCVGGADEPLGVVELLSVRGGATALAAGRDAWVTDFVDSMAVDRRDGCDPDYELVADDVVDAEVAGQDGFRYGFTGSIDGRPVERVVGHAVVVGDDLHLLVANGLADDGCLARESELPLDVARQLEPVLAALAAGSSGLPSP